MYSFKKGKELNYIQVKVFNYIWQKGLYIKEIAKSLNMKNSEVLKIVEELKTKGVVL